MARDFVKRRPIVCYVAGCSNPIHKRDRCVDHQSQKYGRPRIFKNPRPVRLCLEPDCLEQARIKGRCTRHHNRHRYRTDPTIKEKATARIKMMQQTNPEALKEHQLRFNFNMTMADYHRKLDEQGGRCAICGTDKSGGKSKYFHVDHCHETNKVRGLLCIGCNTGIGLLKDSVSTLQLAIQYLEVHRND